MMMRATILLFLLGAVPLLRADDPKYPAYLLTPAEREAGVVLREFALRFDVEKRTNTERRTIVMTVLDRKKDDEAVLDIPYDKFSRIRSVEGVLYDDMGEEVRELDEDTDMQDESDVSGGTLHDDSRVRHFRMAHDRVPYTVEYHIEIEHRATFHWPSWSAQPDEYPVQHSLFEVSVPAGSALRWWSNQDSIRPVITTEDGRTVHRWSVSNMRQQMPDERYADDLDIVPVVRIAPSSFTMEGFDGEMSTWKGFGVWYRKLLVGRQTFTPAVLKELAAILPPVSLPPRERIRRLYTFMQERSRYVSVQLGIGGWQPYDAMYVHERSYGDCKALTNYMQSLLEAAGIVSYPVLIRAGASRHRLITEFPSNQFNHMILCVPNAGDTVWLECTSRVMPFGRLSDFTEARDCLLITPDGGVIVRTRASTAEENEQRTSARLILQKDGTVFADAAMTFSGDQQADVQGVLAPQPVQGRREWLINRLSTPKMELTSLGFTGMEDRSPDIIMNFTATFRQFASSTANRIFITPSVINRRTFIPAEKGNRRWPVRRAYPYRDTDSLLLVLPDGYRVETLPSPLEVNAPFGSFRASVIPSGDTAIVYRSALTMSAREIPITQYDEYRTFHQKIVQGDRAKVVLKKKE